MIVRCIWLNYFKRETKTSNFRDGVVSTSTLLLYPPLYGAMTCNHKIPSTRGHRFIVLQCVNALMNLTRNEMINYKKYAYLKNSRGKYQNPFTRGAAINVLEFFGCTLKNGTNYEEDRYDWLNDCYCYKYYRRAKPITNQQGRCCARKVGVPARNRCPTF